MTYYEVIFEGGAHSIMTGEENEILMFATNQHARARIGISGGPAGHPAERILRILTYDQDPGSVAAATAASPDVATSIIKKAKKDATDENGILDLAMFSRLVMPQALIDAAEGESHYATPETGELDNALWGGNQ